MWRWGREIPPLRSIIGNLPYADPLIVDHLDDNAEPQCRSRFVENLRLLCDVKIRIGIVHVPKILPKFLLLSLYEKMSQGILGIVD